MTWSGVHLVLAKWFKHKICVIYFTETISGSFGNEQVNKIRHYVLPIILGLIRDHCVMKKKSKNHTLYVK